MKRLENSGTPVAHLTERIRTANDVPTDQRGAFVLYFMQHAMRDHENPALDVALIMGKVLQVPTLVYQELGVGSPYASDRHVTFILEGARDLEASFRDRGIPYVFFMPDTPGQKSPLLGLAGRAALVVAEEMPIPPFKDGLTVLASTARVAVWAVDCACIVPMMSSLGSFDRAYRFRDAVKDQMNNRLSIPWPAHPFTPRPFEQDLGFHPLSLADSDISDLCSKRYIDHSIGPVSHTPGGSTEGYARWNRFKEQGLEGYARLRNDAAVAFPQGVSRMSPYLHFGQVSPFRMAREAAAVKGKGPRKFLDELIVWRELAHHFCFHEPNPDRLDALPDWARKTLQDHRGDPRNNQYSWEQLARGKTGDTVWDAAQTSLLRHGELHNNLRMTWGKAILHWTPDPESALETLIDLNHRYAMDGNDPSSYGGLLWCLGLFDRPFYPDLSVQGRLRPRSTRSHAQRLDMAAYRHRISRPAQDRVLSIAVVGAGVSGLTAARILSDHGHDVTVYEKERGPGGRLGVPGAEPHPMDMGAQYMTARDHRIIPYVRSWTDQSILSRWKGRIVSVESGRIRTKRNHPDRWVGIPQMGGIATHLASDLRVICRVAAIALDREDHQWRLSLSGARTPDLFDAVIIAAPPSAVLDLLQGNHPVAAAVTPVTMNPCWSAAAVFGTPIDAPFDGAFINDSPVRWAARDSSKRIGSSPETWVLHADADWSKANAHTPPEDVAHKMLKAFFRSVGLDPKSPSRATGYLWQDAAPVNPLAAGCVWDPGDRIGACGDWCHGSRVEGAMLSGMAIAGRVMALHPRKGGSLGRTMRPHRKPATKG